MIIHITACGGKRKKQKLTTLIRNLQVIKQSEASHMITSKLMCFEWRHRSKWKSHPLRELMTKFQKNQQIHSAQISKDA